MPQTTDDAPERRIAAHGKSGTGVPTRQCAVTRETHPQTDMIRFARSPDGVAIPDIHGKLPGRGVWITANRETMNAATPAVFGRSFKADTRTIENLSAIIEQQIAEQCIGLIGMGKKSGQVVLGFDQVRAYLRSCEPGWLLEASDGAADGRNKVHFLAKAIYEDVNVAGALSSAELGMAFGRDSVIHALFETGRLANSFGIAYRRLIGFRPAPETGWFTGRQAKT